MSDYNKITNFTIKDSLPSGNTNKIIKGTELDNEFNAIQSAVSSKADANSPAFSGTPTAPTAASGTNTTQIATTAYVYNSPTINSPVFTGTPTAPTATEGTSTTQLATTAFVTAAASAVLVDSSVTTSKLAANAVTPAKVSADTYAINISGNAATASSATIANNGAKAWAYINGTIASGSPIKSYNVSSYTRTATGQWTLTFSTPVTDADYSAIATVSSAGGGYIARAGVVVRTTTSCDVATNFSVDGSAINVKFSFALFD